MKTLDQVKQIVKELTRENFESYREDWENGEVFLRNLAHGYWEARREHEIERDENLGITEEDYYDFVSEANDEICEECDW